MENLSKKQIEKLAKDQVINQIEEAMFDPLKEYIALKRLALDTNTRLRALESAAIEEYEKYGEKDLRAFGASINLKNGAAKYDFSQDAEYAQILSQLKSRENLLKDAIRSDATLVDGDGAEVPKLKPVSYNKDSFTIIL